MRKQNGGKHDRFSSQSQRATTRGGLDAGNYTDKTQDFQEMPHYDIANDRFSREVDGENPVVNADWMEVERYMKTTFGLEHVVSAFQGHTAHNKRTKVLIHYRMYILPQESEVGAIIIVPGFTESLVLYQEVIFDLLNSGYSVFIHDHRGQGFSSRIIEPEETQMTLRHGTSENRDEVKNTYGFIDNFDFLVQDLATFVQIVCEKRNASDKPLACFSKKPPALPVPRPLAVFINLPMLSR